MIARVYFAPSKECHGIRQHFFSRLTALPEIDENDLFVYTGNGSTLSGRGLQGRRLLSSRVEIRTR